MRIEDQTRSRTRGETLTPHMALVPAAPEAVSVALVRYASNSTSIGADDDHVAPGGTPRWSAERAPDGRQAVTLTSRDGPLRSLVLRFSGESDGHGATMLWITGNYESRRSRLYGVLERWLAQREACALRDGVVAAVTALVGQQADQSVTALRKSPRARIRAHARLCVANRGWLGEALDVSAGGMALVIACPPAYVEGTADFLLRQKAGDVAFALPGSAERVPVLIRRARPGRGGLEVGLQALETQKMLPLMRKAFAPR